MTVNPSAFGPKPQFVDLAGNPAIGYQLFFYVAGSTSTKQDTFTSSSGSVANTNPIVLNALGEPGTQIWWPAGQSFKVVLAPPTDTDPPTSPVWTVDNLYGINDFTNAPAQSQWVVSLLTPTFVNATSFTLTGNQTADFHPGRRLRTVNTGGTIYSTIVSSVFTTLTTVTVVNDSGVLDSGLSQVSYGLLTATNPAIPAIGSYGQCQLVKNGANLQLNPKNGNLLTINGVAERIPSTPPTIAATGLPGTTLEYTYAYMNGAAMALEFSTTAYSVDATTGMPIKTGDATRTLVGMAYIESAATFTDTDAKKFVRSAWNDHGITAKNNFGADSTSAVTAGFAEVAAGRRAQFITWAGENITGYASGATFNSGANVNRTGLGYDSTSVAQDGAGQAAMTAANSPIPQAIVFGQNSVTEGLHYITLLGYVNAGTGTWTGTSPLAWTWNVTTNGRP